MRAIKSDDFIDPRGYFFIFTVGPERNDPMRHIPSYFEIRVDYEPFSKQRFDLTSRNGVFATATRLFASLGPFWFQIV